MNLTDQLEFVHYLNLVDIKPHAKGYNFKHNCYTGLDRKRRGYILVGKNDSITVFCHNCNHSSSLKKFIEQTSPLVYEDYCKREREGYLKDGILPKKSTFKMYDVDNNLRLFNFSKYFVPVIQNKEAISYLQKRKVPEEKIEKLLWCNHSSMPFGNKIIFPFKKGSLNFGFQGRTIQGKMFYNFSPNDSFKVYNIFDIQPKQDVFVFESIIDSFYKKNSIASLGTSLSSHVAKMIPNRVFVLDQDKAGMNRALRLLDENERVVIYPSTVKRKDCNELIVKDGWKAEDVEDMILNNIHQGTTGKAVLKMNMMRKF